jgi:hypothetical protein
VSCVVLVPPCLILWHADSHTTSPGEHMWLILCCTTCYMLDSSGRMRRHAAAVRLSGSTNLIQPRITQQHRACASLLKPPLQMLPVANVGLSTFLLPLYINHCFVPACRSAVRVCAELIAGHHVICQTFGSTYLSHFSHALELAARACCSFLGGPG